jgi:RNA polymerase sigma-70 factor (ECF subfamily)
MEHDLHVIQRVRGGAVESFRELVERYQGPLLALIRNLVDDVGDCEDLAQDTFLAAYASLHRYDPNRAKFSTWLFTIARNRCLSWLKKKRPVTITATSEPPDCRHPGDNLARDELHQRLDAALQELPWEQRRAFVLFEFHDLPYQEISQIEGVKIGTVKSRINRARTKLKAVFADVEERL